MHDNYNYDTKIIEFIYSKNYEHVFLNLVTAKWSWILIIRYWDSIIINVGCHRHKMSLNVPLQLLFFSLGANNLRILSKVFIDINYPVKQYHIFSSFSDHTLFSVFTFLSKFWWVVTEQQLEATWSVVVY